MRDLSPGLCGVTRSPVPTGGPGEDLLGHRVQHITLDGRQEDGQPALPFFAPGQPGGAGAEDRVELIAAAADRELQPFADEQVGGGGRLGQQHRLLVTGGQDGRAQGDVRGVLAGG